VLLEGGYEARSRPWHPDLEERIVKKVHDIVGQLTKRD
jgi:neutral ceramidase